MLAPVPFSHSKINPTENLQRKEVVFIGSAEVREQQRAAVSLNVTLSVAETPLKVAVNIDLIITSLTAPCSHPPDRRARANTATTSDTRAS